MNTIAKNPCKVVTGKKCIMSYLNVNEPKTPLGGGTPKYSVSIIIPNCDHIDDLKKCIKKSGRGGDFPLRGRLPLVSR